MKLQNIHQIFDAVYIGFSSWVLNSSQSELIIDDPAQGCIFVPLNIGPGFTVINRSSKVFELIQIDNRLLPAQRGGQCDCAFVYDESFNLLEFKTNTTTFNKRKAKKHYVKAEKQLKNTISRFHSAGIDVLMLATDVEAHICFNNTFPRRKSSEMTRSVRFANETGGVSLFFDMNKMI